jgi:excisionase family DNA binding protein
MADTPQQRFLKLDQVGEELNISTNQVYALVRRGDLRAIKIGGRGQWRVERDRLEENIEHAYAETRDYI